VKQAFGKITKVTNGRKLYDITENVLNWVKAQQIESGLLTLNILHTSSSLLVNENYDSDVLIDLENFFSGLVGDGDKSFTHVAEGSDDMPAHIRTALTQTNLSFSVENKEISLGRWQGIFIFEHRYDEFIRTVNLHIMGE